MPDHTETPQPAEDHRWDDLRQRLAKAEMALQRMADDCDPYTNEHRQRLRLLGKVEGVALALSYMRDYR